MRSTVTKRISAEIDRRRSWPKAPLAESILMTIFREMMKTQHIDRLSAHMKTDLYRIYLSCGSSSNLSFRAEKSLVTFNYIDYPHQTNHDTNTCIRFGWNIIMTGNTNLSFVLVTTSSRLGTGRSYEFMNVYDLYYIILYIIFYIS